MNKQQKFQPKPNKSSFKSNINPKKPAGTQSKPVSQPKPKPKPAASVSSLKHLEQKKKQIFKPILSNPYTKRNTWPVIKPEVAKDLLDLQCSSILQQVGKYNQITTQERTNLQIQEPEVLKYVTYGFNSVMSKLESQVQRLRVKAKKTKTPLDPKDDIECVFVCKLDLSTPLLYQHFPVLSQLAKVKLVQLPRSSNIRLQKALGSRTTVEILCLSRGAFEVDGSGKALREIINSSVDDVNIGFLNSIEKFETDVKFLLTDQPAKQTRR